jgi:hypothetical protein
MMPSAHKVLQYHVAQATLQVMPPVQEVGSRKRARV